MTFAVCFKCGEQKWGALNPCEKCAAEPRSEDGLAMSLAMSDHYFDAETMKEMGVAIAVGRPPQLDPQTKARLIAAIQSMPFAPNGAKRAGSQVTRQPPNMGVMAKLSDKLFCNLRDLTR